MDRIDYDLLAAAIVRAQHNKVGPELACSGEKDPKLGTAKITVDLSTDKKRRAEGGSVGKVVAATGSSGGGEPVEEKPGVLGDASCAREGAIAIDGAGDEDEAHRSWDEMIEDSASSSSSGSSMKSGGGVGFVTDLTRRSVMFGGVVQDGPMVHVEHAGRSFYADFVRGSHAVALYKRLQVLGVRLPKNARAELAYASYTAGTMPTLAVDGKLRLRGLAVVGDAAITLHLANKMYHSGSPVESIQQARAKYTSDKNLVEVMHKLGLLKCVSFAPGVDPRTAKAGATAFEAIIGVMTIHLPPSAVASFVNAHGVFMV